MSPYLRSNRDRFVDTQDFNILASGFGTAAAFSSGDFNYDAIVSSTDFDLLLSQYGKRLAAPAPATAQIRASAPTTGIFNHDQPIADTASIELLA